MRIRHTLLAAASFLAVATGALGMAGAANAQVTTTQQAAARAAAVRPDSTCYWYTIADPVLYVRSGPGGSYPVKGEIPYGTLVSGNCSPANGYWYFILDPFDNTYHWANGYYLSYDG
jgi:uncharacterized protein YgiM (DUF1202 family)